MSKDVTKVKNSALKENKRSSKLLLLILLVLSKFIFITYFRILGFFFTLAVQHCEQFTTVSSFGWHGTLLNLGIFIKNCLSGKWT